MSSIQLAKGKCLCGSVEVQAQAMNRSVGACHCGSCRKWGAGPMLAVDCGSAVKFGGESNIQRYASSEWAERGFCSKCGTHLFYRLKQNNQYIMPPDIFDDTQELTFDHQIFVEEKPEYYTFANSTKNMTGAEAFAAFSPSST